MKEMDVLRMQLESTTPDRRLEWAKQFRFLPPNKQWECREYDDKAKLAYQILNRAATEDLEQIEDWFLPRWECGAISVAQTFGDNPSLEFNNIYEFAQCLLRKTINTKPFALSEWIYANANRKGPYEEVFAGWLESAFDRSSIDAAQVLLEICNCYYHKMGVGSRFPVYTSVVRFMKSWYEDEKKGGKSMVNFFRGFGDMEETGAQIIFRIMLDLKSGNL